MSSATEEPIRAITSVPIRFRKSAGLYTFIFHPFSFLFLLWTLTPGNIARKILGCHGSNSELEPHREVRLLKFSNFRSPHHGVFDAFHDDLHSGLDILGEIGSFVLEGSGSGNPFSDNVGSCLDDSLDPCLSSYHSLSSSGPGQETKCPAFSVGVILVLLISGGRRGGSMTIASSSVRFSGCWVGRVEGMM